MRITNTIAAATTPGLLWVVDPSPFGFDNLNPTLLLVMAWHLYLCKLSPAPSQKNTAVAAVPEPGLI